MALFVYNSGECEVLVRDDFLNKLRQNQDVIYCDEVQKRDCYKVRELHANQFRPAVIVDIGAQIGTFSMLAAKYWPEARIFCYEPVPVQCRVLRRNAPSALCHENAVIGFYGKEDSSDVHKCTYHVHDPEAPHRERRKVGLGPAVCAEEIFTLDGLTTIDFLKIDCEECEVNIFRELDTLDRLKDINLVHGEWHGTAAREEIVKRFSKTHYVNLPLPNPEPRGGLFFCKRR